MPISFVGASSSELASNHATVPAHLAGDLILILSVRTTSTSALTTPSGYSVLYKPLSLLAYRFATEDSAESLVTITNTQRSVVLVYRGVDPASMVSGSFFYSRSSRSTLVLSNIPQHEPRASCIVAMFVSASSTAAASVTTQLSDFNIRATNTSGVAADLFADSFAGRSIDLFTPTTSSYAFLALVPADHETLPVVARDSFAGIVGTPLISWNSSWTPSPAFTSVTPTLSSLSSVSNGGIFNYYHGGHPPVTDCVVRAVVDVRAVKAYCRAGVTARVNTSENTQYRGELNTGATSGFPERGVFTIRRVRGGSTVTLASASVTLEVKQYALEFSVVGDLLALSVDGVEVLTYVDPDPISSAGNAGILCNNYYSAEDVTVSAFEVENLAATTERQRSRLMLTPW